MTHFTIRFLKLIFGLALFALGVSSTIQANIGYAPWDVFHSGLANTISISIGNATIVSGVVIGLIIILLGEKFGIGTILNMFLIGIFIDIILNSGLIPQMTDFLPGVVMMIGGLFIIAIGSYFYIDSGFGAGPRDSLMVFLKRKTGISIGICRASIELTMALIGWLMGGSLGLGTLLSAFGIGFCVQLVFSLFKFDSTKVQHETILDTLKVLKTSTQNI